MLTKNQVLANLQTLPEEFSLDELIDRLIFIQKIENGVKQSEEDEVKTTEEAKEKLKKWLK
jgi:hypothetical protein